MKAKSIMLLVITMFLLSGCWDAKDIEDLDIATSVVVDKDDEGYIFYISVPTIASGQKTGGGDGEGRGSKFSVMYGRGVSFVQARENLERVADEPVYLGAAQALIFTQRFAESGIMEYIMRFRQLPDYRKTLYTVISPNDPKELLKLETENAQSVGLAINKMITNLSESGEAFKFNMGNVLATISSPNKCYLLHTFAIKDKDLRLSGYSVFHGGEYEGFIPIEESHGIVMLKAKKPQFRYAVPYSNGRVSVIVRKSKKKIKANYDGQNIKFDIHFDVYTQQLYPNKDVKISPQQKTEIEDNLAKILLEELTMAINTSRDKFACDYLEFYSIFEIAYPDAAKNIDWKTQYPGAQFNIGVKANLDLTGNIDYSQRGAVGE